MDIVIGRVAQVHIDDKVIMDNGQLDIKSIRPIARLGYYDYTVVDEIFEMKAPAASKEELAGLEGRNFDNTNKESLFITKNEIIFILNSSFRFINEN
ncbi:hypothetical protein [Limosilactobacillus reuteri]|uniref:hypothetical protein n=1 Tax=Limosilactobacillus reuteri TaxID=1598 RepID=UPI000A7BEB68|nr:hypothetical protein [Limosilactobacillus reuteri]